MAPLGSKHRLDSAALESWLHKEVAPALDRLRADPSRALSLNEVRAALAAEHAQAVAAKTNR
jgi:hypothetical protein